MNEPSMDDTAAGKGPTLPQEDGGKQRGSAEPIKGKCAARLRLSNPARYCIKDPLAGRKRCRLHGGLSKAGAASARWTTGLRSKYLPKGLLQRYETARADTELLKLREDVALVEAMLATNTARLKDDRPLTVGQESRILALMEQRRRLIESEARRLKDLHQMISIERYLAQMQAVGHAIVQEVLDPAQLDRIHRRLAKLLLAPANERDPE